MYAKHLDGRRQTRHSDFYHYFATLSELVQNPFPVSSACFLHTHTHTVLCIALCYVVAKSDVLLSTSKPPGCSFQPGLTCIKGLATCEGI